MYIPSVFPEHEFPGPHSTGEGKGKKKERKKETASSCLLHQA
jgi:hypothetical protein